MKKLYSVAQGIFASAAVLALLALATPSQAAEAPQVITVVKITGHARYSVDGSKSWTTLHRGDVLQPGTTIQTAEESTVDIVLGPRMNINGATTSTAPPSSGSGNGPKADIIRIFQSSTLGVDKLIQEKTGVDEVSETQLDLRAGRIMGNVKKLSAASRYEVKLPNGVAGIRGTAYMIDSNGTIYVLDGQVVVTYVGGNGQMFTQTVSTGQSFDPFWDPTLNNGQGGDGTVAGPGRLTTLPPDTLAQLQIIYNQIVLESGNPENLPPALNNIVVELSPSGGVPQVTLPNQNP
jgi:hypothetical protein